MYILVLLLSVQFQAQDLLLKQETKNVLSDENEFGPNKKKYAHSTLGVDFAVPFRQPDEVLIHGGSSFSATYGMRIKRKLNEAFSIGYDIRFNHTQYRSKRDTSAIYTQVYDVVAPDSLFTDKLGYLSFQLAPYFRVNFGKRGNHLGRYIDIGFRGELLASTRHVLKVEHPTDESIKSTVVKTKGLGFVRRFQYAPELRYGNAYYNIFFSYRLSDLFNEKLGNERYEMPKLSFGLAVVLS